MGTARVDVAAHPVGTLTFRSKLVEAAPETGPGALGSIDDVVLFAHEAVNIATAASPASGRSFLIATLSSM